MSRSGYTEQILHAIVLIFCWTAWVSCTQERSSTSYDLLSTQASPWNPLNISGGYSLDIFEDSIVPIISMGDTLQTGVPIPVKGKMIEIDSIKKPRIVPAKTPVKRSITWNVRKVPSYLKSRQIDERKLKRSTTNIGSRFVLLNSAGDTMATGIPIQIRGTSVPYRQSKPLSSQTPRVKDNAIFNIQYFDIEEGLTNSQITSVLEDIRGNMWFGSYVGGACKYNGSTFTSFTTRNGLSNDYVTCMIEDERGHLWFGTHGGGLCRYDGISFMYLTEREGLTSNFINKIYEDKKGYIWIGTRDKGVSCYKPSVNSQQDTIWHYAAKEGLFDLTINDILEDQDGKIWFATDQWGAIQFEPTKSTSTGLFTYYTLNDSLYGNSITTLLEDHKGNLWFGTRNSGLLRYDGLSLTQLSDHEGLSSNLIRSIFEDDQGNIWIGTKGGGVDKFDGKTLTNFSENNGMTSNIVRSICEDRSGNIWFGTNGGGVCTYKANSFVHFTSQSGMTNFKTEDIYQDRQGRLWFATSGDGVFCYEHSGDNLSATLIQYTMHHGLPRNDISCIAEDQQGNKWFGTSGGGAFKYDGKSFTYFTKESGLSDNDIRQILVDDYGNIWFGTGNGGITVYRPSDEKHDNLFFHYTEIEGLPCNSLRTIFKDNKGNIWIGTRGCGLTKFETTPLGMEGVFTNYSTKEGFSDNFFNAIIEDKFGNLWFGTGRGVNVFAPNKNEPGGNLFFIGERQGLASQYVRSMQEDANGQIWVGTANGLSMITPDSGKVRPYHVVSFFKQQGLKGGEFEFNSALIDRNNQAWWGNEKCVEMLDLNHFQLSNQTTIPQLNYIEINGDFIDFRNIPDSQGQHITFSDVVAFENYPQNLQLTFANNHLTFFFNSNDGAEPANIRYSYMLENLEHAWSIPSGENKAEYRNLPPGTFTFKVRAIRESNRWTNPFMYTFIIHPPWWRSGWAFIFYLILGLGIVRFIYRFQLARKLDFEEKKKLVELDKLKNKLYTNITHEFRTPLTLIHGPLSNALTTQSGLEESDMKSMYEQSKRLQQLITQMLDLQKLEAGKLKPNYIHDDIVGFTRYLFDAFALLAKEKEISLEFNSSHDEIQMDYDVEKITQIVTNLLSNAIKHTPRRGKVSTKLQATHTCDSLLVMFQDTGVGISPEDLPFVFDRYFQSSQAAQGGTGIGLELTKNLVELLGGEIKVESTIHAGTTFIVKLPVKHTAKDYQYDAQPTQDKEIKVLDDEIRFLVPDYNTSDKPIVLIIEDHTEVSRYISQCLARDFTTITAFDGEEGLQKAFEHIPDLVISDVMMPGKDGFVVCATLKNNIQTSHIPVILLTGRGDQPALIEGIEKGADAYVIKPFEPQELILRVKKLLELRTNLSQHYRRNAITDTPEHSKQSSPIENEFLQKIRAFVEEHLNDSRFNMDMLCQQMAMSHPQLHRKITALTGESTGKFVRSVRLTKAMDLLRNSELTISEIAYETGFSEPGYFTKVFSKEFNKTPTEFRS